MLLEVVVKREDELLGELVSASERSSLRVAALTWHPRFPKLFRLVHFMISLSATISRPSQAFAPRFVTAPARPLWRFPCSSTVRPAHHRSRSQAPATQARLDVAAIGSFEWETPTRIGHIPPLPQLVGRHIHAHRLAAQPAPRCRAAAPACSRRRLRAPYSLGLSSVLFSRFDLQRYNIP